MRKVTAVFFACAMLGSRTVLAADEVKPVAPNAGVEPQSAPQSELDASTIKAMRTSCYTSVRDCAGTTIFGPFQQDMGCAVWWNDGAGGVRNFTLKAGQREPVNVRFNDTGACVAVRYAPPNYDKGRYYLWIP